MRLSHLLPLLLLAGIVVTGPAKTALAAGPRNPYSSFNLSGINYGSQQWERDQRAGRVVEPQRVAAVAHRHLEAGRVGDRPGQRRRRG